MKHPLLLGTAGHIDHGKTALIKALTGFDTDRLPEEKSRGISIDLGFAPLELDEFLLGVVDVPGHAKFVKNMLAGASGVDLALLVVAVDDSVMPQTREHLEILQHLRLPRGAGVVALTKCDLAKSDWVDLVAKDVEELTEGTFLECAEIVRVSVRQSHGVKQLREAIQRAAKHAYQYKTEQTNLPFRMAIDRVFTKEGQGAIVTGSISSGEVRQGDVLDLLPQGQSVRVRALQNHEQTAEKLQRGQRAAINLAGVQYDQIKRGQCLSAPDSLQVSQLITASVQPHRNVTHALKNNAKLRIHLGTTEVIGRLKLFDRPELTPGEKALAQIALQKEVAVAWGQPFVLRTLSPVSTWGGGVLLEPNARRKKKLDSGQVKALMDLASDEEAHRAAAAYLLHDTVRLRIPRLHAVAGVTRSQQVVAELLDKQILCELPVPGDENWILHEAVLCSLSKRFQEELLTAHRQKPLRLWVEVSRLFKRFQDVEPNLLGSLVTHLANNEIITTSASGVALADWRPTLTAKQQKAYQQIKEMLSAGGLRPPSLAVVGEELGLLQRELEPLIDLGVEQQILVRISRQHCLTAETICSARETLIANAREHEQLTVSQIREVLNTSRKIAVPLCEHLDAVGFTSRRSDLRRIVGS